MEKTISNIEVIIEGVTINESFNIDKYVHQDYISNVQCTMHGEKEVKVTAKIESNNRNKNYLIFQDFKEFSLRLFVLFGVNVKINETKTRIDTDNDYQRLERIISPPMEIVDLNKVRIYEEVIKRSLHERQNNSEFYNLIEANQDVDIVHRFRSLFAAFDKIAPKKANGYSIDYHNMKERYIDIINSLYTDHMLARYFEIINELIKVNIIDERAGQNYSDNLEEEFEKLERGSIINEKVAFNLLKCIQGVRNKINHGDFEGLTPKSVSGSYELLLPLTKNLMKKMLEVQ